MTNFKVIAAEHPFMIPFSPMNPLTICVLHKEDIYLSYDGELTKIDKYDACIKSISHAVNEGKYEWTDFYIEPNDIICRDFDDDIFLDGQQIEPFRPLDDTGKKDISHTTLIMFNDFLKRCNKDNRDMVEALKLSLNDGFFLQEIKGIIATDEIGDLSDLEKEIIVRCKIEKEDFIKSYVQELLNSNPHDKYIDINYFFRKVFCLETFNYISFK